MYVTREWMTGDQVRVGDRLIEYRAAGTAISQTVLSGNGKVLKVVADGRRYDGYVGYDGTFHAGTSRDLEWLVERDLPSQTNRDPRTLAVSTCGKYAVVDSHGYAGLHKVVERAGGFCMCGGPDPLGRAIKMFSVVVEDDFRIREEELVLCTVSRPVHVQHTIVRRLDLPWERGDVATTPIKKTVSDWPIACPKCHRNESAVLLFSTYDCKHGCYRC